MRQIDTQIFNYIYETNYHNTDLSEERNPKSANLNFNTSFAK